MVRLKRNIINRLLLNKSAVRTLLLLSSAALAGHMIFVSLPSNSNRSLSLYLGNGDCKWEPPADDFPEGIDFGKTIIVDNPGSDDSLTVMQMEALTGWAAQDDWDFRYLGMSNHPFIKSHYPHPEGEKAAMVRYTFWIPLHAYVHINLLVNQFCY